MKKLSYILVAGVALMVGVSSCTKDIKEINKVNPGQFSDSDPTLMITGAQLANVLVNEEKLLDWQVSSLATTMAMIVSLYRMHSII